MKKIIFILLSGLVVVYAQTLFSAPNTDQDKSHGASSECDTFAHEHHLYLKNAEALNLSAAQMKKLRKISGACMNECLIDRTRLRDAENQFSAMLKSGNINKEIMKQRAKEISELNNNLRVRIIRTKAEAMMVLTQSQQEKAKMLHSGAY